MVGAAAALPAQPAEAADAINWDREVDVVVIGAGAGGLVAAIAAREKGASVLIVEKNFDIGGRAMMSFGGLYIGGGNRLQKARGVKDTPDLVFADWSRPEKPMGRFSDRELVPMPTTISTCLTGWRSTASSGRDTAACPIASIAAAPGSTWCIGPTSRPRPPAAPVSSGRWKRPRGRWASRSCFSSRFNGLTPTRHQVTFLVPIACKSTKLGTSTC